jgi:large subunit ribosomal protein L25
MKANIRTKTGKGISRAIRRNDGIPAILYGPKSEPLILSVGAKDFETAFKMKESAQVIVNLSVTDDNGVETKKCPALVKDVQLSPLKKELLHADFLEIDLTKKVNVSVPVETFGKSKGVEFGGTLQVARRELEVLCLPLDIPQSIKLDITNLGMGDSIHVNDIKLDGIELPSDINFTVVTIVAPKSAAKEEGGK